MVFDFIIMRGNFRRILGRVNAASHDHISSHKQSAYAAITIGMRSSYVLAKYHMEIKHLEDLIGLEMQSKELSLVVDDIMNSVREISKKMETVAEQTHEMLRRLEDRED
ncbi:unnamed protein product [Ilex paraguariensis]|uniref:Uncharacterized protein n=1 Tax=Ilex paraguariensis TaxID=185542 RepID=A0ABC8RI09_9AQUA